MSIQAIPKHFHVMGPSHEKIESMFKGACTRFPSVALLSDLDPVVQSIASLTSSLVAKMLTVLVSTISNSLDFFAEKM